MKYVVDIDNTICYTKGSDYDNSIPRLDRIKKINQLYDLGHTIVYFTARGMNTYGYPSAYLEAKTLMQLDKWGCKFHDLILGKPSADIYIDDKGINSEQFFN